MQLSQCTLLLHLAETSRRGSGSTSWINRRIIAIILIIIPLHTFQVPNKQKDSALEIQQQHAGIAGGCQSAAFPECHTLTNLQNVASDNPLVLSGFSCGRDPAACRQCAESLALQSSGPYSPLEAEREVKSGLSFPLSPASPALVGICMHCWEHAGRKGASVMRMGRQRCGALHPLSLK